MPRFLAWRPNDRLYFPSYGDLRRGVVFWKKRMSCFEHVKLEGTFLWNISTEIDTVISRREVILNMD